MIAINHEAKLTKKEKFIKLFSGSLIIGVLSRFTDWIYKCIGESLTGRILTGLFYKNKAVLYARL